MKSGKNSLKENSKHFDQVKVEKILEGILNLFYFIKKFMLFSLIFLRLTESYQKISFKLHYFIDSLVPSLAEKRCVEQWAYQSR